MSDRDEELERPRHTPQGRAGDHESPEDDADGEPGATPQQRTDEEQD